MSIVVAVRNREKIIIGCDTATIYGYHRMTTDKLTDSSKVIHVGNAHIGFSGWALYQNIVEDFLERNRESSDFSSRQKTFKFFTSLYRDLKEHYAYMPYGDKDRHFSDLEANFLVASPAGIFEVSGNMSVTESSRFCAIGSGSHYAYGALHIAYTPERELKKICEAALMAACEFDVYCHTPLEFTEIKAARTPAERSKRKDQDV